MPTIKGTASVADSRARQKALKKTKFPRNFGTSVDLEKVNKPVLTQWIEQKITSILGFEDEIVSSTAINLFLPDDNSSPDPRKAQLDLAGFLGDGAVTFSAELWALMLEAQASTSGIPQTLLDQKKKEMAERMSKNNQGRQQSDKKPARVGRFSQMNQSTGRDQNRMDSERNDSSNRNDDRSNKNTNVVGHNAQQFQRDKPKNDRKSASADIVGERVDQFGRVYTPQRSRDSQRNASRDYDRNRPYNFEGPRRRSRSRDRYDHDRERGYNRRRSDDRHRTMNDDARRHYDRRYDSNRHDDRPSYHQPYHGRHEYYDHDRRNRNHDYDREMDHLERRLGQLKRQYSECDKRNDNRTMHRIDNEIKDVQDRIYELERHRRNRYNSSRDNYSHGRSRRSRSRSRSRSPHYEHRRGGRRKRSNSTNSDRSDSDRSRRDDYSTESGDSNRGSHNSYSPSPERTKRNKGKSGSKRHKRRRSRSRSRSFSSSERSEQSS